MQYLHLSNLNENLQVLGNLKFLDLNDDGILEEKTSMKKSSRHSVFFQSAFIYFDFDIDTHRKYNMQI
jgi:hypothetical protein